MKVLRNPYRVIERTSCDVRSSRRASLSEPPFDARIRTGRITITFNAGGRLRIRKGRSVVFDGRECRLNPAERVTVSTDLHEQLVVTRLTNEKWIVRAKTESRALVFLDQDESRRISGPVLQAVAAHAAVVALCFILLSHGARNAGVSEPDSGIAQTLLQAQAMQAEHSKSFEPFAGMSLRGMESYLARKADQLLSPEDRGRKQAEKTLSGLANLAGALGFGSKDKEVPKVPLAKTAANDSHQQLQYVLAARAVESVKSIAAPVVAPRAAAPTGTGTVSSSAESRIQLALESIKPLLSSAFDEALRIDPSLAVTLVYEGVVDPSGRVGTIRLKPRGNGSPAALASLQRSVSEALSSIRLGPELAGKRMQGEQVFVR